jgi:hypothetical protein
MTNKFKKFDRTLCDKLLSFIYIDESNMTDKEVQAELQRLNIDTTASMNKIRTALQKADERSKAQESLAFAKLKRPKMLDMLKNINSSMSGGREGLKQWIIEHLSGSEQAVFCRKLEDASDSDLKSLVEDILRLKDLDDSLDNEK